jgi:hypothetical protein
VLGAGRWRLAPVVVAVAVLTATAVRAHDVAPQPVHELIRMQGFKAPAPAGVQVTREVALVVLGQTIRFAASDWRTFAFFDPHGAPPPAEAPQVTLQGERPLLHSIVTARPDQRITILAERRPGSADAFLLTVDMCPPQ